MSFPEQRPRRLRRTETLRRLVRETRLSPHDFIYPMFVSESATALEPIAGLPGMSRLPVSVVADMAEKAYRLGIMAVILFGIPGKKDATGSSSLSKDGVIQRAVAAIKARCPELLVITDVCLCEYTDHGHCGVVRNGDVDNDATLGILAQQALSHVVAGADMVAPSDMMDGRVATVRRALDEAGFSDRAIMAYSAKFCSAFYGPFREAAGSAPQFGDRQTYQMDPANGREALKEIELDVAEGADIVMVKPALAYLDVIAKARDRFDVPIAAYSVSGEYTMIKLLAERGFADERRLVLETLTSIKRAGADIIITYHALDAARWLKE